MNIDVRTLALTHSECALLAALLGWTMPGEVHEALMAAEPKEPWARTKVLTDLMNQYFELRQMLIWKPEDTTAGRAFRQLNTTGIFKIQSLVLESKIKYAPRQFQQVFAGLAPNIVRALNMALKGDILAPYMGRAPLEKPIAKA